MLYPYPVNKQDYSKEISRIFGILGIFFSFFIAPTGFIMGIIGFYYEFRNAKENSFTYNYQNLFLNAIAIIISSLIISYFLIFKLRWL